MEDYELDYDVQEVRLGNHGFKVTTVANDALPLEMLLSLQARSEEISGQRLWEGSLLLCAYLVEACTNQYSTTTNDKNNNSAGSGDVRGLGKPKLDLRGKAVLELGAGTGIVSMLASKMGASPLVMTDGDKKCVVMAQKNIRENGIPPDEAFVTVLRWGDEESTATFCKEFSEWERRRVVGTASSGKNGVALAAVAQGVALIPGDMAGLAQHQPRTPGSSDNNPQEEPTGVFDVSTDGDAGPPSLPPNAPSSSSSSPLKSFDFILAGDVLYKHCLVDPFLRTVRHMMAPDGLMLLCHVPRAGVAYDIVERAFLEAGFTFEILNVDDKREKTADRKEKEDEEDLGGADARNGAGGSRCDTRAVGGIELCEDDARRARLYELHSVVPRFI